MNDRSSLIPDEEQYDQCVSEFYSAAAGNGSWSRACGALAQFLDVWSIQITGIDKRTRATRFSWDGGSVPAVVWLEYFTRYHLQNPRIPATANLPVGTWFHDHEHFPAPVFEQPFYREFLVPYGGKFCSATKLLDDDEMFVVIAAHTRRGRPPLAPSQVTLLERFRTHLVQAIDVYRRLQRGSAESLIARTMLDALAQPVVLVDDTLYIHHTNRAASELLSSASSLFESNGALRCRYPDDGERLVLALRRLGIAGRAAAETDDIEDHVLLRFGADSQAAELLGIAVGVRPDETMAVFGETNRAILLLHPVNGGAVSVDPLIISYAFGLTPAEAQVAASLAAGGSLSSIAAERGVSLETVRTQLKTIYAKVGVSRQAALVRAITLLPQTSFGLAGPSRQ